ncbi:MAG: SH3 domain-containing protein [Duganella sp.]
MEPAKLCAAFGAGLVLTLCLAAYLTPRSWWRRLNARALLIAGVGAWVFGSLILDALPGAQPVVAATLPVPGAGAVDQPPSMFAGRQFHVHRALNLRATAGVDAPRLRTVPAGATVTATGRRNGDWWQVTASGDGGECTGWVSSLWLRRDGDATEARP